MASFGTSNYGRMDAHSHTVYTTEYPGRRAGNGLCGACVGLVMLLGAVPMLVWNEGAVVTTTRSLDEGLALVRTVDPARADAANASAATPTSPSTRDS